MNPPYPPPSDPAATGLNPPAPDPYVPPGGEGQPAPGPHTAAGPPQYAPPSYPNAYPTTSPTALYGYAYGYPPAPLPAGPRRKWGWWIVLGVTVALLGLSGLVWAAMSLGPNVGSAVASAENGQPARPADVSANRLSDLGAGECFNSDEPLTDSDSSVTNVDCANLHLYEVFFYFEENDASNSSTSSAMYACQREAAGRVAVGLQVIGIPSGAASLDDGLSGVYCVIKAPSANWSGSHSHALQVPPAA